MLRGFLLGSVSGLAVSGLLAASASLLVLPPEATRPASASPAGPVLRDQAETVPRVPDPLPARAADDPVRVPDSGADAAPGAASVAEPPVETAGKTGNATDPEADPADTVPLPAGSQFNRPPEDRVAVAPDADAAPRTQASGEGLAPGAAPGAAPAFQTESANRPETGDVAALSAAPEAGDSPARPAQIEERAPVTFGTPAPSEDDPATEPPVASDPAVPPAPEAASDASDEAREAGAEADAGKDGEAPAVRLVPEEDVVDAPVSVQFEDATAEEAGEDDGPQGDRVMPSRIVLDSARAVARAEPPSAGALSTQAAPFDNPADLPMFAVVLIDTGAPEADRESLAAIDFPVTFAVDPMRPGAEEAARIYREAGHEVVLLGAALAAEGAAQDVEVAMSAARRAIPQALAVLDAPDGAFAENRAALSALLPPLAEAGMGFLAYPDGLDTGVTRARKEGVPSTTLYRTLDADGEGPSVMARYLDRATFEATRAGAVVVVGRISEDVVTALYTWRLGDRAGRVIGAPLSAILEPEG